MRKPSCCVGVIGTGSLTANESHASLIEFAKCSAESRSGKAGEKVPRSWLNRNTTQVEIGKRIKFLMPA